ncbi:MAG: M48 family metalloprotease [Sedimentisphaerales bacterium]|nr:M48 family metalloprotease [Sedimentisphaerales bacterium]
MDQLNMILQSESCMNLLSALLHSLWQGLIIAGMLLLYLKSKAAQNANTRYTVSLIALSFILICLLFTWSILNYEPASTIEENTVTTESAAQIDTALVEHQNNQPAITHTETQYTSTSFNWKPPVIGLWLTGMLIMLFRAIYIIAGGAKLQVQCDELKDERILEIVDKLRKNLRINRKIKVAVSEYVTVPGVIGFFSPLLLLPVSLITGVPDEALKAILAHELAHIRRYDYLVNFCQMVIEAILFFNPAVWWISRQIRIEREVCCDNAGIASIGRRIRYAEVLVDWAQKMKERDMETVELAIGFGKQNDNSGMLERIKRIISSDHRPGLKVSWHIATITLVLSIATLAALWQGTNITVALAGKLSIRPDRTIHFPKDYSIGELYIRNQDIFANDYYAWVNWNWLGYAKGDITVPAGMAIKLDITEEAWKNKKFYPGLKPDDIQMLSLEKYPKAGNEVLKDISSLTDIQALSLSGTQIYGGLQYLKNLKKLQWISFAGTIIWEEELEALTELPSMEYINFNNVAIDNEAMIHVGKIKSLKALVLNGTSISDKGLEYLKDLSSLRELSLWNTAITDEGLKYLAGLTELEDLDLVGTKISSEGLIHFAKLKNLKNLRLARTKVGDEGLNYLKQLKSLEYIELPADTHISDEGLAYLSELKSLKKLFLISDSITEKGLDSLSKLPLLEDFSTGGSSTIDDTSIEKIAEFPALKYLWIQNCQVTDEGLAKLKKLKTLKTLKIANSPVTCDGLSVLKELPSLTGLELNNLFIGDTRLAALEGLTSLETLKLNSIQVTDNDLAYLTSLTNLKTLEIRKFPYLAKLEISDKGIQHLGKIKSLNSLILDGQAITDDGLTYLEGLNSLNYLALIDTKVTEEGILKLKEKIPALEYQF